MTLRLGPEEAASRRFADSLVRAARAEGPSRAAYRRTLKALLPGSVVGGASALTSAAAAATKASALSVSLGLAAKWGTAGILAGATALGAARYVNDSAPADVREPATPVAVGPSKDPVVSAPSPAPELSTPIREAPILAAPPPAARPAARAAAPPDDALAAEAELLGLASDELRAGRAKSALEVLARHRRAHPSAKLGLEASVLTIEALFASGRAERARRLAREVLSAHPQTVFARRIQAYLQKDEAEREARR